MKKRILSLVLMISMVVMLLLPTTVFANANVIERTLDIVYNGPSKICVEQDFTFSYTIPDNYRSSFSFVYIDFDVDGRLLDFHPSDVSRNGQTFTVTVTSERLKSRAGNSSSCVVYMGADHNSGWEYGTGYIRVAIEIGHIDVNKDHVCDVETCKATVETCEDADKDHKCDYGCGKDFGTHVDADLNHICDYGCDEAIGICADADYDHKCDYGCGKNFGTHVDADLNHICDYGCKEAIGICADADKDHKCDYGCGKDFGTHVDADLNHICDYGCKEAIGICADADKDHKCDYGCGKTFGVCSGGTATCKDNAVCDYCGKPYGELNSSNHAGGTEVRNAKDATCTEDGYTGDTYCKGCETKLSSGKSVDKTGHDYESKVTKEATTTSTGTKTYTCKNCGHSYEEEIAKLPSQSTSPKTGDETPLVATIVVTLLSAAALIGLVTYKKRGRYSAK